MKLWPSKSNATIARFAFMLIVLAATIYYAIQLRQAQFGPAFVAAGRFFMARVFQALVNKPEAQESKEIEVDSAYASALGTQMAIAEKSNQFFRELGTPPSVITDLARYGLPPADQVDPWGRPYRLRLIGLQLLVIQSTGPSGVDSVQGRDTQIAKLAAERKFFLLGDNLFVVQKFLSTKRRLQDVAPGAR